MGIGARVLVVEDDPDLLLLTRLQLESAGFEVLGAATAGEGLTSVEASPPDVVLLDWTLPDGDGIGVLRRIRAGEATAELPVIMVTAKGHPQDRAAAWESGVDDFVTKPFDVDDLVERIHTLIADPDPARRDVRRRDALAQLRDPGDHRVAPRAATLLGDSPDAVVTSSLQGVITSWNHGAESLYGYRAREVIGRRADILVPPASDEDVAAVLEGIASGSSVAPYEATRRRKDGTDVVVSVSVAPVRDAAGHIVGAVTIARDVTERKANESLFRGLLEAAPDAMVVADVHGRIQLVNARTEEVFGYRRDELVGELIEVLVPESVRHRHPEHRTGYVGDRPVRPGGHGLVSDKNLDLAARRKDGSVFPAEISLSSIETERGRLVSAAIRDVSERKAAEERFRGLVDAAPDAMVIVDADGRIELVNAQAEVLFGYERGELLSRPVEVLVPQRFRGVHGQHREHYATHAHVRPMGHGDTLYGRRKDGSEFPVEISLSPLRNGDRLSISAAIRDVSERKRAEALQVEAFDREREASQRLREVDRLRSEFLSTVSHELRTPLTAIRGFSDLLVSGWEQTDEPTRFEMLQRIARASQRLDQLIEDLLDFSRLERGSFGIDLRGHELRVLVDAAVTQVAVALDGHEVEVDVPAGLVCLADETAMARVLVNLLTNAAKFSPAGSAIAVRGRRDRDRVVLDVEDRGIGIPTEEQPRIFDRFYRGAQAGAGRPGTGVGLAIVKELTEAQGGEVLVSSAVGVGSTFSLVLAVAQS